MTSGARTMLAAVTGLVVAIVSVWLVQMIGHMVYPPPELDFSDPGQLRKALADLPPGAFLVVIGSYALGAFAGGLVAGLVAGRRQLLLACIVAALVLTGTILNVLTIPHPVWFTVLAIVAIVAVVFPAALLASYLGWKEPLSG